MEADRSAFRRAVWGAVGVGVVTMVIALVWAVWLMGIAGWTGGRFKEIASFFPVLALLSAAGAAYVYLSTAVTNTVWNHARLGSHRFVSSLEFLPMLALHTTSLVAIVGTVGLAIPWARVRLARYRAAHLTVLVAGEIGALVNLEGFDDEAFGSEAADALDIAVGL